MNLIKKCTVLLCLTLFHTNHAMIIPVAATAAKAIGMKIFVAATVTLPATLPATLPTVAPVVVPVAKAAVSGMAILKGAGGLAGLGGLLLAAKKLFATPQPPQATTSNTTSVASHITPAVVQLARRRALSLPDRVDPLPPWQAPRGQEELSASSHQYNHDAEFLEPALHSAQPLIDPPLESNVVHTELSGAQQTQDGDELPHTPHPPYVWFEGNTLKIQWGTQVAEDTKAAPRDKLYELAFSSNNDDDDSIPCLIHIPDTKDDTSIRKGVRKGPEEPRIMPSRYPDTELEKIEGQIEDCIKRGDIEGLKKIKEYIHGPRFPWDKLFRHTRNKIGELCRKIREALTELEKKKRDRESPQQPVNKTPQESVLPTPTNKEPIDTPIPQPVPPVDHIPEPRTDPQPASTQQQNTTDSSSTPPPPPQTPDDESSTSIEETNDDDLSGVLLLAFAGLSIKSTHDDDTREAAPVRRMPRNNGRFAQQPLPHMRAVGLPTTGAQTTANMPTAVSSSLPQSGVSVANANASSSTTQAPVNSDLPATGANTSSAPSLMPDTTSIILDFEQKAALDQMLLDMVTTSPTPLAIDQRVQELMDAIVEELSATYAFDDPMIYVAAFEKTLVRMQEMEQQATERHILREKDSAESYACLKALPNDWEFLRCSAQGFADRITDPQFIPDGVHGYYGLAKLSVLTLGDLGSIALQVSTHPLTLPSLSPNSPWCKFAKSITRENVDKVCSALMTLSLREINYIVGRLAADALLFSWVHRGVGASLRLARDMAKLSVGAKAASSIGRAAMKIKKFTPANVATTIKNIIPANITSKVKNLIPAAEEAVAVTAEGVPVRVATAAGETMSFQNAANKVGGAVKEVAKKEKELVEWTSHGFKHKAKKNVPWKDTVKGTRHAKACYKPGIKIRELEEVAWKLGTPTTNGRNWKVFKCDEVIGAKLGKETCYMRVECSANTIHGHPILESEYWGYLK
jgi:hypothetical protein